VFAPQSQAWKLARIIPRQCETCQAHNPTTDPIRGPIEQIVVPPTIGDSVSIDIFEMPIATWGGEMFDAMAVCVDRNSGWMVATPQQRKGLTAKKVATGMYRDFWEPLGVPSIVTSDRGPQFAGSWWSTICAQIGIRRAYAQAYHHQANGRAEVIGRELKRHLRKLTDEEHANWVELLPLVRQHMHDIPGPTGLSPYEIVYGRQRPMKGLPYKPPIEAEDATRFFSRMEKLMAKVAEQLNEMHKKAAEYINEKRKNKSIYGVGEKVWYMRPQDKSANLQSKWVGPCEILRRVGQGS